MSQNLRTWDPLARPVVPFQREEFVRSRGIAVIDGVALYLWWAHDEFKRIVDAVTGGPEQYGRQ